MYQVEYIYENGYLDRALDKAAHFIKKINEDKVVSVSSEKHDQLGWTIIITYQAEKKK